MKTTNNEDFLYNIMNINNAKGQYNDNNFWYTEAGS